MVAAAQWRFGLPTYTLTGTHMYARTCTYTLMQVCYAFLNNHIDQHARPDPHVCTQTKYILVKIPIS